MVRAKAEDENSDAPQKVRAKGSRVNSSIVLWSSVRARWLTSAAPTACGVPAAETADSPGQRSSAPLSPDRATVRAGILIAFITGNLTGQSAASEPTKVLVPQRAPGGRVAAGGLGGEAEVRLGRLRFSPATAWVFTSRAGGEAAKAGRRQRCGRFRSR